MSKATPFFANFIESQVEELTTEELSQASGGSIFGDFDKGSKPPIYVTMKHPSDDDEGIKPPIYVTMKAPSDDDEGAKDFEF